MLSIVPLEYDTKENMGKTRGILTSIPESTLMIEKAYFRNIVVQKESTKQNKQDKNKSLFVIGKKNGYSMPGSKRI